MRNTFAFQRLAAVTAMLSAPLAWGSLIIGLSGVNYDFDVFSDATLLITIGVDAASLIRWSLLLNMFGNYLLLIPLILFLWHWLSVESPLYAILYSLAGFLYTLLGAIGAAILASVWPMLIIDYAQATAAQQEMLVILFKVVTGITEEGIQSIVQNIPAALWFWGIGRLLMAQRHRLGFFAALLGVFLLVNSVGTLLNNEMLSLIGLTANVLLAPLWAFLMGIDLFRYAVQAK